MRKCHYGRVDESLHDEGISKIWPMPYDTPERPALRRCLAALLGFIALNAFGGGAYGMSGAKGVPTQWLAGTPFRDYFLPSLFLFVAVGGTWLAAAMLVLVRHRADKAAAMAAGLLGLLWIGAQVSLIGYVSWLQPAVALASLAVLALARALKPAGGPQPEQGAQRSTVTR